MKQALRFVALALTAGATWVACDAISYHIFIAGQYDPKQDCVQPGEAVDVIGGPGIDATCDATCVQLPFEGGVYVTGACAPFPPGDLVNPENPQCPKALAAIHRSDLCLDGGPSNPATDAGIDALADVARAADAPTSDVGGGSEGGRE